MNRPTLGVVAISYNEERDLPGFLEHLLPWVDEIVIVDDGSTDRTAEIAAAGGDRVRFLVSPRAEGAYYSDQRNKGIDAATSDWLLHMDIDERVPPELAAEILEAIRDDGKDGYRFRRLNFFLHRPMRAGGWERWNLVHLARRTRFRFGGKMHETCLLDAPPVRVGQLEHPMWHYNDVDYTERLGKSATYSRIAAEDLLESGRTVRPRDLVLSPVRRFVSAFVLKRGYRDGTPGLLFALHSAMADFQAKALAWDAQNAVPRTAMEGQFEALWEQAPDTSRPSPSPPST